MTGLQMALLSGLLLGVGLVILIRQITPYQVDAADFTSLALTNSGFTGGDLALLTDYFDQWLFLSGKPTIVPSSFP